MAVVMQTGKNPTNKSVSLQFIFFVFNTLLINAETVAKKNSYECFHVYAMNIVRLEGPSAIPHSPVFRLNEATGMYIDVDPQQRLILQLQAVYLFQPSIDTITGE